ncbi:MAG: AAA family ATPase [Methylococcaceae bacterium]|nr:MAG: AAA family ATPase [Methylococcaceae bacterium]
MANNGAPPGAAEDRALQVGSTLYLNYFGLREHPFALTPDTSYYFDYFNYREALSVLLVALRSGEGFIKLTGEVGMGKTLLCRRLMELLGDGFVTAYVPSPLLSGHGMLRAVAEELRVNVFDHMDGYEIIKSITHRLAQHHAEGKSVVLLIDEAQVMSRGALEAVRLLSNIETEKSKLLQVVLFAQPELDQRLQTEALRQFQQRIIFSHVLQPLDKTGLTGYINHRIMLAGYNGKPPFSAAALNEIFRATRGVPRLINIVSHKSLMLAFGSGLRQVTRKMVREAVGETEGVIKTQTHKPRRWLVMTLAAMLTFAMGWYGAGMLH